jgi:hypothetical protein
VADLALEERLVALGAAMTFPAAESLADDVVAALDAPAAPDARDAPRPGAAHRRWLLAAAAVLLAVAVVTAAVPASRRAVARWLGFDDFRIEPVVELEPIPEGAATSASDPLPGPGIVVASTVVDGAPVLVAELPGTLEARLLTKQIGRGTTVTAVSVAGDAGFWIAGAPHTLLYLDDRGEVLEARVAGNVLVWQHGATIRRVEGARTLEQALEVASRAW